MHVLKAIGEVDRYDRLFYGACMRKDAAPPRVRVRHGRRRLRLGGGGFVERENTAMTCPSAAGVKSISLSRQNVENGNLNSPGEKRCLSRFSNSNDPHEKWVEMDCTNSYLCTFALFLAGRVTRSFWKIHPQKKVCVDQGHRGR